MWDMFIKKIEETKSFFAIHGNMKSFLLFLCKQSGETLIETKQYQFGIALSQFEKLDPKNGQLVLLCKKNEKSLEIPLGKIEDENKEWEKINNFLFQFKIECVHEYEKTPCPFCKKGMRWCPKCNDVQSSLYCKIHCFSPFRECQCKGIGFTIDKKKNIKNCLHKEYLL